MEIITTYRSAESYLAELVSNPQYLRRFAESEIGLAVTRALTQLRKSRGVSREDFAERIGRPASYVAQLEEGAYARCPLPALRTFARALGYDVDVRAMFHDMGTPAYAHDVGVDKFLDAELSPAASNVDADPRERGERAPRRWEHVVRAAETGEPIQAVVTAAVKGGLLVDIGGVRGFVPASQTGVRVGENLDRLVGKRSPMVVLALDRDRKRAVLSLRQTPLRSLKPGQVRQGVVVQIADFGAFVDLGGVEGLVHVGEIARERVKHPSDVLTVGTVVTVVVLKVDSENRKISLSIKRAVPHLAEHADRQPVLAGAGAVNASWRGSGL